MLSATDYRRLFVTGCAIAACASSFAACGDSDSDSPTPATNSGGDAAPAAIADAGELVSCSDLTIPPYIFSEDNGEPAGRDVDLGNAIAKRFGVEMTFQQTGFDGIVAALQSGKCDVIINDLYVTPERARVIDFVEYARAGEALLVPKGNPKGITELDDLSGKRIAGTVGSTTEQFLSKTSDDFEAEGKEPIDVVVLNAEPDAANAVKTGDIDGAWLGAPSVDLYAKRNPEDLESWGDLQLNENKVGIGVAKDAGELTTALKTAVDALYSDGTTCDIFAEWGLSSSVLEGQCG